MKDESQWIGPEKGREFDLLSSAERGEESWEEGYAYKGRKRERIGRSTIGWILSNYNWTHRL